MRISDWSSDVCSSDLLVAERHVDGGPDAAQLLRRRYQRRAFLHRLTQRLAQARMQDGGGMLQLAALADDGGLAIALDNTGIDIERCDRLVAEQLAQLLADLHQDLQVEIGRAHV